MWVKWLVLFWAACPFVSVLGMYAKCERKPSKVLADKIPNDSRFLIELSGNPSGYTPFETYTLTLKHNPEYTNPTSFKEFILTIEHQPTSDALEATYSTNPGKFDILANDKLAAFSIHCKNMIIQTNSLPKNEIKVNWTAPESGSGCVAFKAAVMVSSNEWFADDGPLTKILCEEMTSNEDLQPPILKYCCACDEAKYELVFEGMWTRNTHPKDYPSDVFRVKFSDMIGSSHGVNAAFWAYYGKASEGMRILGENGDTGELENEIKLMSRNVRTIIKLNGLTYPHLTSKSYTVFRVDNNKHLLSVVSKITPSPDWVVGVSNLELCQRNCTWVESRVLNLYPWDIGTMDGISYEDEKYKDHKRTRSPDLIKKITPSSPNDFRSPFYDEEGNEMKPLARLYVNKLKQYEKECAAAPSNPTDDDNIEIPDAECATDSWSEWSPCSEPCGVGVKYRSRRLLQPEKQATCNVKYVETKRCVGISHQCEKTLEEEDPKCELEEFGEWSSCSASCGKGVRTRDRKFKDPMFAALCKNNEPGSLQETEECRPQEDCEEEVEENEEECEEAQWDAWSACNVTCGTGYKVRYRVPIEESDDDRGDDSDVCTGQENVQMVECNEKPCSEFGDMESESIVLDRNLDGAVINCKVTKWSIWGPCKISGKCGKGYRTKYRRIIQFPTNGGSACPQKMIRRVGCRIPCRSDREKPSHPGHWPDRDIDCRLGPWSRWSPCTKNCGTESYRQRSRDVITPKQGRGAECGKRIEYKKCPLMACDENGRPIM